jgi:alpha-N-acetylglucosamine transferase
MNIYIQEIPLKEYSVEGINLHRFAVTINKFECLKLIEYDKVMFLDADVIVF